jgi:Carboxypeptidase regulatory-like domain
MLSRSLVLLALVMAAAASPARGQSQATTGQIAGQVVDSSGSVLPGVTVVIAQDATGFTRETTTDEQGFYRAILLPPGAYRVTAKLAGFQDATASDIQVTVGSIVTVNLPMTVGAVQETITVTGASPLVEATSTRSSATLDSSAISNLPINGRRFQDLVLLTPTAQVDPQRGQISLAGQRGINSNVSIDGADYNQPFFGGIRGGERSNFAFTIPQEAIQEFQVVPSGYSAEFGRSSGGLVNAVTKSGSNAFHGSAFYVNRNEELAAKNAFDQDAVPTQQQFGGSVGGPLKRDRLFFFGAYEQQEFDAPRQVLFDRLIGFAPTAATQEAFDYHKSLETAFKDTNDATAWLARADVQISPANRVNVRYNGSRNEALNAASVGGALAPTTTSALSNNGTERDRTNTVVGQYTSVISESLLFEARGQYSREVRPREANELSPNVSTAIGNYGTRNFLPTTQYDWRAQGAANMTWISGERTVKLGAEYNHVFVNQLFGFNQYGQYSVSGTNTATVLDILGTGGAIANRFDNSAVTYNQQIGNTLAEFATDEIALFGQLSWRLRPTLTVDAGLRWEGQYNPSPDANNDFLINAVSGFQFPIGRTVDPTRIPDAGSQFGPRLGVAWDPLGDSKTVVRGFGGIYHARTPMLILAAPMNNFRIPPGDVSTRLPFTVPAGNPNNTLYRQLLLIGVDLNRFSLGGLPTITPDQINNVARALGLNPNPFLGANVLAMDEDYENPESYQLGAGVEREIRQGLTVGADFIYVKTNNLQRNFEVNLPSPRIRPTDPAQRPFFGLRSGTPRPQPLVGSVQLRDASARSLYRGLTLNTKMRKSWGQFSLYYVLSKSKSDDDNERDAGGAQYENAFNLGPEYSAARLDRRHQFNGDVVVYLPWEVHVATGFQARSGVPIDASFGADANEDIGGPDRPYSAPGVPFERNAFRNEPVYEVNLRLQKGIALGASRRAIVSAEFFNLFNADNIQLAGATVTNYCTTTPSVPLDCGFGAPTNPTFLALRDQSGALIQSNRPGVPFQVQLGVRLQF